MENAAPLFSATQSLALRLLPPVMGLSVRALAATWRVRLQVEAGTLPQDCEGPAIYCMWHECVLTVTGHWRDNDIQGLASESFDGTLIAKTMGHLGYPVLSRGSSSRGGAGGLRSHLEALNSGRHVVVTVDGPQGPPHEPKAGVVVLAARKNRPLIPVACAVDRRWRLRSWDRTQVPPPFAKVAFTLGPKIYVKPGEETDGIARLKAAMDANQAAAQTLLESA